ncbi:MAG: VWA domain-containing protein [Methylococcaceae bacterium]|nr:MAG: VWA domain-containing protein [Methylococcaceae bacterium]
MPILADFHFLRPLWLLGLIPLILALWRLHRQKRQQGDWAALCDAWLLPHVLIDRPGHARRYGLLLLGLGGVLALLALAGPVWEREPTPALRNEQALVIALSLSATMDAADVKPSRLERARFKIADLLQARKDGQTALIAYAGDAFTVTPLTNDVETIRAQLSALTTAIMPVQGARAELALQQAAKLLQQAGLRSGHVLLICDDAKAVAQAEQLHSQGYAVSVLGVGTAQGAPVAAPGGGFPEALVIPRGRGGFLKTDDGAIIVSKLNAAALQALATAGGGRYLAVANDNSDIQSLQQSFDRRMAAQGAEDAGQTLLDQWQDMGPWLLLPLLPLAALAFRRGVLVMAVLVLALPWSNDAAAWEWRDLWQTPDQQAQQAMRQQDYAAAAQRFQDPAWKGAAHYRAGEYEQAAQAWAGLDDAESWYNQGNAWAQAGKYQEAIAAYDKALQKQPGMADAKHNKAEVEKRLQQQQPPPPSSGGQDKPKDQQEPRKPGENKPQDKSSNGEERRDGQSEGDESDGKSQAGQDAAQKSPAKPDQPESNARQPRQQSGQDGKDQPPVSAKKSVAAEEKTPPDEAQQANEAWLKRIPDDPGGLLKRKFQYQYQQRRRE